MKAESSKLARVIRRNPPKDRYGSIEPGRIANLALLKANPLETIEAYDAIDRVILQGKVVKTEESYLFSPVLGGTRELKEYH